MVRYYRQKDPSKMTCGLCHGDGCDYCFDTGQLKYPETGVFYTREAWDEYQGHGLRLIAVDPSDKEI